MNPLELRPQAPERCAFCHDDLDEATAVCASCRTVLHRDCRELLGVCPTLGCRESRFTLRPGAAALPIRRRPAFDRALANLAARADSVQPAPVLPRHPDRRPGERPIPGQLGWLLEGETCAVCRHHVHHNEDLWECFACGVVAHPGCAKLYAACMTIGCEGGGTVYVARGIVRMEPMDEAPAREEPVREELSWKESLHEEPAKEGPPPRSREAFENAKKRLLERSAERPREPDALGPGLDAAEIERARREYREARATADAILTKPARPSWLRRLLGRIVGRP